MKELSQIAIGTLLFAVIFISVWSGVMIMGIRRTLKGGPKESKEPKNKRRVAAWGDEP